ncbi:Uncharacterised protein [Pseudomonas fluorescens]|uniref:Uncharacterized protein n=1 Tax=Pseudomonas fluorescens TaxID=294 RepID=A0A3S4T350_PSEFL|nr:Uncharacterised protein [Pseudomonas fluorescens]
MPKNISFGTKEICFSLNIICMLPALEACHV